VHDNVGYNYKMTNLHAAVGTAQINKIKKILINKKKIFDFYCKQSNSIRGVSMIKSPNYCVSNNWINLLKIDDKIYKQSVKQLISFFTKHQIQVRPVWFLNHLQKPYKNSQSYKITNAKKLINKILCLPSSSNLKKSQIQKIFNLLKEKKN
jgi:perosamine synthetase